MSGALADGDVTLPDSPQFAVQLLMLGAEFADDDVVDRLWDAVDDAFEPTWPDGEFTFGFGLGE